MRRAELGWTLGVHVAGYDQPMGLRRYHRQHRTFPRRAADPGRLSAWLDRADSALGLLAVMRAGGVLERALATVTLGMLVKRVLRPEAGTDARLRALGLEARTFVYGHQWLEALRSSHARLEMIGSLGEHEWAYFWPDLGLAASGGDDEVEDWMAKPGAEHLLSEVIAPQVWARSSHLQILSGRDEDGDVDGIELIPLPPAGDLVGRVPLDELSGRPNSRKGRTLLVRGPSGVGKSTVARTLASKAAGSLGRLLQIPAEVMERMSSRGLRELVTVLRPDVLVIDDIPFDGDGPGLLTRLEVVRSPAMIVVLTQMTDPEDMDPEPAPGALYNPGMRPGRIDEIITVPPPDEASRRTILEHYLGATPPERAVTATEGLTGAYLKELAERLRRDGEADLDREIASLMAQAPVFHAQQSRRRPVRRAYFGR